MTEPPPDHVPTPLPPVPSWGSRPPATGDGSPPSAAVGPAVAPSPPWLAGAIAIALAVGAFATGAVADRAGLLPAAPTVAASPTPSSDDPDLALVDEAWNTILDNYVDARNLDRHALAYGAIEGMTNAVGDEGHTTFLTADEAKALDESLSGTFVGIGVQVTEDAGRVVVADVIPATPAEEAGLQRGDAILEVDGAATADRTIDEVVAMVRGPEGGPVTLTISRAGSSEPFEVTIVRRRFDLPLVGWAMVPGWTIALVRLEQFATGATAAVKDAIRDSRAAGATALILDLRANPGGYVNEAVGVASQFVGDGLVYRSIDATGAEEAVPVEAGGLATEMPLVVLADGETASASEIVTGAIQDAGRGRVVGERTFGTGTVLGRFDLADGSSMRIGVERWLTRDGRPIWHEGLEPDVSVPMAMDVPLLRPDDVRDLDAAALAVSGDVQLLRAIELLAGAG